MKTLLLSVTFFTTIVTSSAQCDACLDGACYTKTPVSKASRIIGQMAIDRSTNTLYVTDEPGFSNVALNLENLSYKIKQDYHEGSPLLTDSRAVDYKSRDLYLGTRMRGMFKYIPYTNRIVLLECVGIDIRKLWFNKKIYYSTYQNGICYLENDDWICVPSLRNEHIDDFVVDKNYDIYWRNNDRHYRFETASNETKYLFTDAYALIYTNIYDEVYYIQGDKVTKLNYDTGEIVRVGIIKNAYVRDADFDRDNNLVYNDIGGIQTTFKLQLNQQYKCNVSYDIIRLREVRIIHSWKKSNITGSG